MLYKRARGEVICCVFLRLPRSCWGCVIGSGLWPCPEVPACCWHPGHSQPSVGVPFIPRKVRFVAFVPPAVFCWVFPDAGMLQVGQALDITLGDVQPGSETCPCIPMSLPRVFPLFKEFLTGKEAVSSSFPPLTPMVSDSFPDCFPSNINTPLEQAQDILTPQRGQEWQSA